MSEQNKSYENPPPRWVLKLFTRLNVVVYKLSSGRLMNRLAGMPIVLVEMTGASSGRRRTIPLMYVPHGDGFLLVASQGGATRNPVWYENLMKNPSVLITFEGKTTEMTARYLEESEKAAVWPTCVEFYPPYQNYQDRTDRQIPVFLCEATS
ncbi:nitroreductase family deazaflavin-dependent oxidoreductase [Gammaproteobacteria bacterium]|nr:nitroreductase family deazaflavin-dependent oxidoreductase [Gammaproteobacteria bacterium]